MDDDRARQKALNTAANVLQYRHRSRAALLKRLLEKEIPEPDARYAVDRLTALGLLDDADYAHQLAEGYAGRGYGAGYIRRALREKGIEPADIDDVIEDFEPREDKLARYIAQRMDGKEPDRKLVKKVSDGLFRRGFSWDEIRAALGRYTDNLEDDHLE